MKNNGIMIKSEDIMKLGFEYDDFVGKYFLVIEHGNSMAQIDLKHAVNDKYFFTRMESGATLRFYTVEQLNEFLNMVKRSLRKE